VVTTLVWEGALPKWDMDRVVRDHYDAVYRFCARRIGVARAADTAQETFVTAQRALSRFRGESSLRTWLLGIALNECRRSIRRHGTDPLPLDVDLVCKSSDDESAFVDRQALASALARLSDDHREVVLLHELQGLTYEEVATVLNVPVGTVKSRLHHAFINLRRELA
jgi:RNA polymerase sigma-70 factor, ECF subfamily